MNDLDIIAQINKKIQQLPSNVLPEVDDYVSFLLYKYQPPMIKVGKNTSEITNADMSLAKQQVIQLRFQELAGSWEG